MEKKSKYLFGPVPSRRLGLSLGVDIVPFKTCTLNCLYCQIGRTPQTTIERKPYVLSETIISEIKEKLAQGLTADYITLSGSGEPTLNTDLGKIIDQVRQLTHIPIAIITNGTLLYDPAVRADCEKADVVLPSLDASDEQTFQKINRPHPDITLQKLIDGLIAFRRDFSGQIWLEVFLIEGVNSSDDQIQALKGLIERIAPDKVQLNTAVRPTAEPDVVRFDLDKLQEIALKLGPKAEVVADFAAHHVKETAEKGAEDILSMLKRRPCSLEDIAPHSASAATKPQNTSPSSRTKASSDQKKKIKPSILLQI